VVVSSAPMSSTRHQNRGVRVPIGNGGSNLEAWLLTDRTGR